MAEATGHYAMTIHRMLKWEPLESRFYHDTKHPLKCDLLVVDEVSMLDMSLAVCLMRAVRQGTSVVFVGDSDQLPSVGPGNVLNDIICSGIAPVTHLSKIFRQGEGSGIIKSAHIVNQGMLPEFPENTGRELRDFYWIEETNPEKVLELIIKMVVERIPRRFGINPVNSIQVLTPMKRGVCGTDSINAALQKSLNPGPKPQFDSGDRIFRAGDRIIQRKNNYEKNIFNGDMGRIVRIDYSDKTFTAMFGERKVKYEITDANQVSLAYAITVHKSQGSEFPVVILPMLNQHYMLLQRKLLYTGMTRAKKLLILTGSRKAVSMAVNNAGAKLRYSLLPERLKDIKRNY
jgi:exodeoxyribonuclease V alpha subunit